MGKLRKTKKLIGMALIFAVVIGTIGAVRVEITERFGDEIAESGGKIYKTTEIPDFQTPKGQRLLDVFNNSIERLQFDAPMDYPAEDVTEDKAEYKEFRVSESVLESVKETHSVDWAIARIEALYDFAENLYTLIELSPFGYMIYHNDSGVFAERSGFETSPYEEIYGDLYYGGYSRHFYGNTDGSLTCVYSELLTEAYVIEREDWARQSEEFTDILFAQADFSVIDYVEYGTSMIRQNSGGRSGGTPVYITVAYGANGGSGTVPLPHLNILSGSTITVGSPNLSKAGFSFRGWRSASSSIIYQVGEKAKITGSGTVYLEALWMPNPNGNNPQTISERENNDGFNRANPIPGDLVDIAGMIGPGDEDFFRLYNNTNSAVEISLLAPPNSICRIDIFSGASDLSWYGTTSNTNTNSIGRFATMTASFEAGKSYYIKVSYTSGSSGSYSISIRRPEWAYMFRARTGFANKISHGYPHYSDCYGTCGSSMCHRGLDIVNKEGGGYRTYGMSVYSVAAGTVEWSGFLGNYGHCVEIQHTGSNSNRRTLYAHFGTDAAGNSTIPASVRKDATVTNGTMLGKAGWSGNVIPKNIYGTHLHFEIRVNGSLVNPVNYFPSGTFVY
ncbi:MAG: peptidoglycan DD-metalloendopeptidase family protein [Oscillospiraceae bacterium]|nr:peptidoglycan DD-metalloendopeptidase family protein [Oscillospiraceae bacterium]